MPASCQTAHSPAGSAQAAQRQAGAHLQRGIPCIRGLRIPVATVVGMIADGMTERETLKAYPDLVRDDIRAALYCKREPTAFFV